MFIGLHILSNLLKKEKSGNYLFPKPLSQNPWVSCTLAWDINAYTGVYRYSLCSFPSVLFYVFHHGTSGTESSSFSQSAGNYWVSINLQMKPKSPSSLNLHDELLFCFQYNVNFPALD